MQLSSKHVFQSVIIFKYNLFLSEYTKIFFENVPHIEIEYFTELV